MEPLEEMLEDMSFWDPFADLLEYCVSPVLQQAIGRLLPVLCGALVVGEFLQRGFCGRITNIISIIGGLLVLQSLVDQREGLMYVFVTVLTYIWVRISSRRPTRTSYVSFLVISLTYLVFREYVPLFGYQPWAQIRGISMISFMKTISLIYEITSGERGEVPTANEYFGYMFFPGTLPFGPWISYVEHSSLLNHSTWTTNYFRWLMVTVYKLTSAFSYLLMSTCVIQYINQSMEIESAYVQLFVDAMTVRFSHYFICQLSEAVCLLAGPRTPEAELKSPVASPFRVEFPRSLVDVVVNWNIPMHRWLKRHIYNPLRMNGVGNTKAGIFTFIVSAMLHGFNLNLTAVLLSIGVYCYIEYNFRQALAASLNSCVCVRPCSRCDHKYRNHLPVQLINFGMLLLAVFNLAYLGALLDEGQASGDFDSNDDGIFSNISKRFACWAEVEYSSHTIMFWIFVFTYFLRIFPLF